MNDEDLEKLVEEEMEAYFNEHHLPEDRAGPCCSTGGGSSARSPG